MKKLFIFFMMLFSFLTLSASDMICYKVVKAFSATKFKLDCGVIERDYYTVIVGLEFTSRAAKHKARKLVKEIVDMAVVAIVKKPKVDKINKRVEAWDIEFSGTSIREELKKKGYIK